MSSPRYSIATLSATQIWEIGQTDDLQEAHNLARNRLPHLSRYHYALIISDKGEEIARYARED